MPPIRLAAEINEEYLTVPTIVSEAVRPVVVGPQAALFRYSNATEKALASLGEYDPDADTQYDWPNLPDGALVDLDYVSVYFDNALLRYYHDAVSSGGEIVPVSGRTNRIRSTVTSFKENGDDYPRSASMYDRDVTVGDVAIVSGTVDSALVELETTVIGFVGDAVDAEVAAAESDANNQATQSFTASVDKIAGVENCVNAAADASAYDGLEDGDVSEVYTVEVLTSSVDGDYTTATMRVTSASGNDDVASFTPGANGEPTDIGTRGLIGIFDNASGTSCSSAAELEDVSAYDLIAGQKWRFSVNQAFTAPAATSGGTYTGDSDTTYIITVTKGGLYADEPEITVSTSTGIDVSGPTVVSAAATAVAVGTQGVTVEFDQAGLCEGDRYTIVATAEAEGFLRTLILADDLPDDLIAAADLDLKLYIPRSGLLITKNRTESPPDLNWEEETDNIVIKQDITAYDVTWTDDGEQLPLPVESADVYVQYRAWITDYVGEFGTISDIGLIESILGPIHPDNPLSWGVYKTKQQMSVGSSVSFTSVATAQEYANWVDAANFLAYREGCYALVPLTSNEAIQDYFVDHCADQSGDRVNMYRRAYLAYGGASTTELVSATTSDDEEVVLARLVDDPESTGTQYTLFQITSGNLNLNTAGVVAGDTVRFQYTSDGFGGSTYTEYEVAEVVSNQSFTVVDGNDVELTTPQKVEIWRTPDNAEITTALLARAAAIDSSLATLIWPDSVSSGGLTYDGYFAACCVAGLRCSAMPHRSLTNIELRGIDSITRTSGFLTPSQIYALRTGGVWVIDQSPDGYVYTVEAVTTRQTQDPNLRLESMVVDVHSCGFVILAEMRDFFARFNITPDSLSVAATQLAAAIEFLRQAARTQELGPMLLDAEVVDFRQHTINRDQMVIALRFSLPTPYSQDTTLVMQI